jgi:mannosyl-oligosaccharide alpha-1,2-mannosidase
MVRSTRRWRFLIVITIIFLFTVWRLSRTTSTEPLDIDTSKPISRPFFPHKPDGKVHFPAHNTEKYPLKDIRPLPTEKPVPIPKIQAPAKHEDDATRNHRLERLAAVKASFVHSWEGYKKEAWLRDEVIPIEGGFRDTFGGWAATLVDSLDGLWIMGLETEFQAAARAVEKIDFSTTHTDRINVFETTIRYLGGLLAAYDISGHRYPVLLRKAEEVGDLLMGSFDTANRLPITRWDWKG